MPRARAVVAAALVATIGVGLTGCGGASTPAPTPTPSAVPLRAIPACAATVAVPDESLSTVPDASAPPTASLEVGGAVTFGVPAGARVGLLDAAAPDVDATLCTVSGTATTTATLVAESEGYLRVGVQVGIQPVATVLVKVTPP